MVQRPSLGPEFEVVLRPFPDFSQGQPYGTSDRPIIVLVKAELSEAHEVRNENRHGEHGQREKFLVASRQGGLGWPPATGLSRDIH
jgi:hypothetical protein